MPIGDRPQLKVVIPGSNENRWSDLLVATDPAPMGRLIGASPTMWIAKPSRVATDGARTDWISS
jgi:hypothetical protein